MSVARKLLAAAAAVSVQLVLELVLGVIAYVRDRNGVGSSPTHDGLLRLLVLNRLSAFPGTFLGARPRWYEVGSWLMGLGVSAVLVALVVVLCARRAAVLGAFVAGWFASVLGTAIAGYCATYVYGTGVFTALPGSFGQSVVYAEGLDNGLHWGLFFGWPVGGAAALGVFLLGQRGRNARAGVPPAGPADSLERLPR